jgi:hypothetical protein
MEQSSSWEANRFSANQGIPSILWISKVHFRLHKFPPLVPILSQINPVHGPHPTSWRPILILSSHLSLGLPSAPFPSGSPPKPVSTSSLPPTCYIPRPFHSFLFDHPNNIWWGVKISELLIMQFSLLSCYLVPSFLNPIATHNYT